MKVIYTGSSDFQIFSADDFKKAGVEDQKKVTFAKGEPTEVSDAAGQALTADEGVFGRHQFEAAKDEDKKIDDSSSGGVEDEDLNLDADEMTESGSPQITETPKTGRTGKGSSTKG